MKHDNEHAKDVKEERPDNTLPGDPNAPVHPDQGLPGEPDTERPGRREKPVKTPGLGAMVHFTGEDLNVYPAIVIGEHEDGTVDLRVQLEYARGTHDRQNAAQSDEGSSATWMEMVAPEERRRRIAAAAKKRAGEEEKVVAEEKKRQDERDKKDSKLLTQELGDLQKRAGEAQKRLHEREHAVQT